MDWHVQFIIILTLLRNLLSQGMAQRGGRGGRFIDGMYTLQEYIHIHYITGITIISDTGIFSDHNLVISKCNLDLPSFVISKEKEERFNF